jgi:hypothetical protein
MHQINGLILSKAERRICRIQCDRYQSFSVPPDRGLIPNPRRFYRIGRPKHDDGMSLLESFLDDLAELCSAANVEVPPHAVSGPFE